MRGKKLNTDKNSARGSSGLIHRDTLDSPSDLTEAAQIEYKRLCDVLDSRGTLPRIDLAVIAEYVPKELSVEEVEKVVDGLKSKGFSDFNALMREAMKELKGRADGKLVGDIVKKKLTPAS